MDIASVDSDSIQWMELLSGTLLWSAGWAMAATAYLRYIGRGWTSSDPHDVLDVNLMHTVVGTVVGLHFMISHGTEIVDDPLRAQVPIVVSLTHITTGYILVDLALVMLGRHFDMSSYALFHVLILGAYGLYLVHGVGVAGVAVGTAGELCVLGIHGNRIFRGWGWEEQRPYTILVWQTATCAGMVICKLFGLGWVALRGLQDIWVNGPGHSVVVTFQTTLCVVGVLMNVATCWPWVTSVIEDWQYRVALWKFQRDCGKDKIS